MKYKGEMYLCKKCIKACKIEVISFINAGLHRNRKIAHTKMKNNPNEKLRVTYIWVNLGALSNSEEYNL